MARTFCQWIVCLAASMRRLSILVAAISALTTPVAQTFSAENQTDITDVGEHDYPMWGRTRARVNAPPGEGIPLDWDLGDAFADRRWRDEPLSYKGLHPDGARNIKWIARLGSQTYGNPTVANGRVFVGTNNGAGYLKRYPPRIDLGVLLCFDEQTGDFLWQHSSPKLPTGRVHDWPLQGVCSTPVVDGDRLWFVTNRGEVVCLDTHGFYDNEDDGPEQGNWVPVFNIHTTHGASLESRRLPQRLRDALVDIGIPARIYVRRGERENQWWLGRSERDDLTRRYQWRTHYELQLHDGQLQVFPARGGDDPRNRTAPLLTIADIPLHVGLDQGKISLALRQTFSAYGVDFTDQLRLKADGEDAWSLTDHGGDVDASYRLRMKCDDVLSAEMLLSPAHRHEADVVWKFDMINRLDVSPHNMSNCSPLIVGNKLFVCTSNGLDESHINCPKPAAPSFIAMDRDTGEVLWSSNLPGNNILHAQWASPSYSVIRGQPKVIFPGGDGWVYSFDPEGDGRGNAKLLWKFDGNPKTSKWILGGRGTRNNIIAFPAIYDELVYITMGQDPEHGEGQGLLWCIDPARHIDGSDVSAELAIGPDGQVIPHRRLQAVDPAKGERAIPNPKSAVIWQYAKFDQNGDGEIDFEEEFHRSMGIATIKDDILYIADFSGLFHCLHAKTGRVHWTHDMFAACWGSALVVDGKVYVGDEDGEISVFRHSADPTVAMKSGPGRDEFDEPIRVMDMRNSIYMTPIVANNVLYVANRTALFAIEAD